METYDVVVAGLGVVGSSVLYAAAKSGLRACGLEQFGLGHDRGSSHGESRIIRKAYFLHPGYVPLLNRAYELWRELEQVTNADLMTLNGLICAGEPEGELIKGLELCYSSHSLPHERLSAEETMRRWPQFHLPESSAVYYDQEGGFLRADRCLSSIQAAARSHGAIIYENEPMLEHSAEIRTSHRTLSAKHLILTSGAWVVPELRRLGAQLRIQRKALFWYRLANPSAFRPDSFPAYIVSQGSHDLYGFPTLDGATMKAAEDTGGQWIDDPLVVDRGYREEDEATLRRFVKQTFPGQIGERASMQTCLYTLSGDHNFVIGNHPDRRDLTLASCCSGHAFKLGPALGEIILQTALNGHPPKSASFLDLSRLLQH